MKLTPNTKGYSKQDLDYIFAYQNARIRRIEISAGLKELCGMEFMYEKDKQRYLTIYGDTYEVNLNDKNIRIDENGLRVCESDYERKWRELKNDEEEYYIMTYTLMKESMVRSEAEMYWKCGDETQNKNIMNGDGEE